MRELLMQEISSRATFEKTLAPDSISLADVPAFIICALENVYVVHESILAVLLPRKTAWLQSNSTWHATQPRKIASLSRAEPRGKEPTQEFLRGFFALRGCTPTGTSLRRAGRNRLLLLFR